MIKSFVFIEKILLNALCLPIALPAYLMASDGQIFFNILAPFKISSWFFPLQKLFILMISQVSNTRRENFLFFFIFYPDIFILARTAFYPLQTLDISKRLGQSTPHIYSTASVLLARPTIVTRTFFSANGDLNSLWKCQFFLGSIYLILEQRYQQITFINLFMIQKMMYNCPSWKLACIVD